MKFPILNLVFINTSKIHSESKSQLAWQCYLTYLRFYQYVKDTFWKQITTVSKTGHDRRCFYQYVKDTFWKQITTVTHSVLSCGQFLSIRQRYILKANHNCNLTLRYIKVVFINTSKIHSESKSQQVIQPQSQKFRFYQYVKDTFWKQITTKRRYDELRASFYQYVKDTFWKQITTQQPDDHSQMMFLSIRQRYILKANHNCQMHQHGRLSVFINTSKIHSESKSQQGPHVLRIHLLEDTVVRL